MSSLDLEHQYSVSTVTITMSKETMAHKLKLSCRLCLNEKRSQVSLFERTSRRTNLTNADIVRLFTDILVDPKDGLPGMICTKCENMLHLILDFKIECQDSNETLMAICEAFHSKEENEELKEDEGNMTVEEEDEEDMYEGNMTVEALEMDEEEEGDTKTAVCKTEPDIAEVVEQETEELEPPPTNTEFVYDNDDKQDFILISVVNEDSVNTDVTDEIWVKKKGTRNKNSECHECGKRVEGPAKLTRHMRVHEREKRKALAPPKPSKEDPSLNTLFKCGVCKKEFALASRLKKHLETHRPMSMREKSYVCHCGKQYLDSGALRTHKLITHTDNVPMYACEICKKEFTRKNYRDYHQRLHTSDKPHCCDICDFRSAKKHNLIRHMLVHNNQYNFECDACGRKFKRKTGLHSHQKTHGCK